MENNINQKVSCVANYSYDASEPDELTLRPGDVLRDVERLSGGWWSGELRGRRGMFPDNFVHVLTDHGLLNRSSGVQGRCRAVFSYHPANSDELPLSVGDVLEVLCEVEEGWWQGRRQGRVGVFPSNFVVMLDQPTAATAPPLYEPAPALPPKPVKELCRVLFPYSAVNEDELTLAEGDIVTVVSKEAPDRGWWRGEINGRVGLFPDNFVQLLPSGETEEKRPDRPLTKNLYPIINKYSEKTSSIKEISTSKTSLHKESTLNKDTTAHKETTVTHTNKSDSEKFIHSETVTDAGLDGQGKKPPVPMKKSPTPTSGVGGLFSGLKNKMMSTSDKDKPATVSSSTSSSSGEWDKPDGVSSSKTAQVNNTGTFDHVERNSILNDPRASRVKAPRRRPPSQALRDDTLQQIGLSNGHEVPGEKAPSEKMEEVKPRAREWEKHRAPWMDELKLNQAKKTSIVDGVKSRSVSTSSESGMSSKAGGGSTDKILECGLEERKSSTHTVEMSKSTSSISNRMSVLESFEETKVRHSLDSKEVTSSKDNDQVILRNSIPVHSPTAAGRTFMSMVEEVKKPIAPSPPAVTVRTTTDLLDKPANRVSVGMNLEKNIEQISAKPNNNTFERTSILNEKLNVTEKSLPLIDDKAIEKEVVSSEKTVNATTLERRSHSMKVLEKNDTTEALINQLNNRVLNLEKLLEVQNAKFTAAIKELNVKLVTESEKRQALQSEVEKLAHCVTQV